MLEVFALILYSVQWLGIAVCVGAETVLLSAHLIARHERQPAWLEHVPGVRSVQGIGLLLIIASGAGAVWYHLLAGQIVVLLVPTFGFKWLLIGLVGIAYLRQRRSAGRAVLEGFAGATWYALFLVHSVAPVATWTDLFVFYAGWLAVFGIGWSTFVLVMHLGKSHAARGAHQPQASQPVHRAEVHQAEVHKPIPKPAPKIAPKKAVPALPQPVVAAAPVLPVAPVASVAAPAPHISFGQRFKNLFARLHRRKQAVATPQPKLIPQSTPLVAASAPAPQPAPLIPSAPVKIVKNIYAHPAQTPAKPAAARPVPGMLAIEYLELEAPHAAPAAPAPTPTQVYEDLPAIQVMPRSAEDAQKASLKFRAV